MTINPNMKRLRRPDLPNIYMGPSASPPTTVLPSAAGPAAPAAKDHLAEAARAQVATLQAEVTKQMEQNRALGEQQVRLQVEASRALQDLDAARAETEQAKKQLAAAEAKVQELLAAPKEALDTPALPDKVWVPVIESRTTENGNAVVACMFHFGDESKTVTGTIYIPTSEIGKLKPVGNRDAGR